MRWTIILPVKRLAVGKSRLRTQLHSTQQLGAGPRGGDDLVLAIALDTVAAVVAGDAIGRVIVVTDDPRVAAGAHRLGAEAVADTPSAGLNAAVAHGEALAAPTDARAALLADLPALRPGELSAALGLVGPAQGRRFVADLAGTGTTLLAAAPGEPLRPSFGPGSAAAHAASGALALDGDWPGLRLDVDTVADLAAARRLGLGERTAAALGEHPLMIDAIR